jgi:hypothetical protein
VNNVTKKNLTNGLFAALLLTSSMAGAETQYPAADFKPKVIYQDAEQIAKHSESTSADAASAQVDSRYPAANFQPKVLYKDAEYKPSQSTAAAASTEYGSTSDAAKTAAGEEAVTSKQDSNWIVLAVLAVAGIIFFIRRSQSTVKGTQTGGSPSAHVSSGVSGGLGGGTGVARYISRSMGTGVSRYLEKQLKTEKAATGVAKYMAKHASSPKVKAPEAATGVEKYMRNRG